ncbi:Ubiquinol oxidase 2, mitochondrial [Capsicum chinense]|nr:Ubiquinol oxidase 2, mitochondrial [Capsicum chinense]
MSLESVKEVWDYLKTEYKGDERIRGMQVLILLCEFELQRMKESETIKEYSDRLLNLANHFRLLGSAFNDSRIIEKILVMAPKRFEATITTLENTKDLSKITLAEILSAFQAQEQRRVIRQRGAVEVQGKDLSVMDSWEKVYPEDAAAISGEKLDDISGLPLDDSGNGLLDIPCPNEVFAKHLGEEISSLENDLVLSGNNSGLAKGGGLCTLNEFQNMTLLEYDSQCKIYLERNILIQRKEMPEASNADKLSELELKNACDVQRENSTQISAALQEIQKTTGRSLTEDKLNVGGMSTSKSRSSGKRKAYGEFTTKRLFESFKENNYPDYDAKEKFEQSGGWIKALPEEIENERMHLMTMVKLVQPKWYERWLVIVVQGAFFNFYFVLYLLFPKLTHRVTRHLEGEVIHSYTLYLNDIDHGEIENIPTPTIAIYYWRLPKDTALKDVDEAYHRDVNHFASLWETYQADLSIDLSKYYVPKKFLEYVAYWSVKLLRIPTKLFFKERYCCSAMKLEIVASVPGMVGGATVKEAYETGWHG